ncbi:hypothetical protein FJT64_001745 [Amphibalanus amphitrite]|uniref:Uncharacterized protein n=1 Tax=Amphibalanus amphitrite TaxID=1232801 RepID=A0A6A4XEE7_AMPAM|nr:hypothetical protein FJT64_001745 [Amphibalanus amphitrite]
MMPVVKPSPSKPVSVPGKGSLCPACVAHSMDCPNGSGASSGFGNGCSSGGGVNGCSSGVSTVSGSGRIAGEPPSSAVSRSTILTKAKPFPVMEGSAVAERPERSV